MSRQFFGSHPSLSLINITSSFIKLTKSSELTNLSDFAAITLPVDVIAVTKEQEFRNHMFLITCCFPFGINEKLLLVNRENEDSSTFTSISSGFITFHYLTSNHCLAKVFFSSSKLTSLESSFLYFMPSIFIKISLTTLCGIAIPISESK